MSPVATKAPTSEQGSLHAGGVVPWALFVGDDLERVPELQWPVSVATYSLMRNDAQVDGLLRGATLPIRRYHWSIDPNGAQDSVVKAISEDLGLPLLDKEDEPRGRTKNRFKFDDHLYHALLALVFGYMYFEQVGEINDALWRLRKLAPRMPQTVTEIQVAEDGGLKWIKQNVGAFPPEINVDRLVCYVWDKEGANWVGRSMLRSLYRHWLVKDRLIRVDAIKHERNGVGMPIIEAPPGATPQQVQALDVLAQQYKAGEVGGGAVPAGSKLRLVGTEGTLPDTVGSIRYHDEQMAGAFLEMFKQLGQTQTGSRALGGTFVDYFELAQETIAIWFRDIFNEHVIEDWVDWNYGESEAAPLLHFDRDKQVNDSTGQLDANGNPVAPLDNAVQGGDVQVTPETAAEIRAARLEWDARHPSAARRSLAQPESRRERVEAAGEPASPVPLPNRPLRRQPNEHEIAAQLDLAQMDSDFTINRDTLVATVRSQQHAQIEELHDLVVATGGDLKKLAEVSATPIHEQAIGDALEAVLEAGVTQAIGEAERQGVSITRPDMDKLKANIRSRAGAVDSMLARSLSETAARKGLQLAGGGLGIKDVANDVRDHLNGLSDTYLADQLGGAITAATNTGRTEVFRRGPAPERFYSSEILDDRTCTLCIGVDGQEYVSISDAERDYPTGGFRDCLGGGRCRGTIIAVYPEASGGDVITVE